MLELTHKCDPQARGAGEKRRGREVEYVYVALARFTLRSAGRQNALGEANPDQVEEDRLHKRNVSADYPYARNRATSVRSRNRNWRVAN
jgi:hypothetical protein